MLPIKDDQPRYSTPYINSFLIGLNLLIFLFEATLDPRSLKALLNQFAVVPSHVSAFLSGSPRYALPAVAIPFLTSMFLHGSWMHVLGNMWFLYIFGDNIEDYLGHFKYLVFYLLAGLLAMTAQVAASPHSTVPTLGASGAIAGVLVASSTPISMNWWCYVQAPRSSTGPNRVAERRSSSREYGWKSSRG